MTAIPMDTLMMIRRAIAPTVAPLHAAFRNLSYKTKLGYHAAKLRLDTEPTVWYYKDTPVEIAYSRSMGFVLLDHVRKLRSPALNSLPDALRARTHTLKEHENAERSDADAPQPGDAGSDAQAADRGQAQVS